MKNFLPHAPRRPGGLFMPNPVILTTARKRDLDSTARAAGVTLSGEAVAVVEVGSMAGEAGVAEGWTLVAVDATDGDGRPWGPRAQVNRFSPGGAAAAFMAVAAEKVSLLFEDPAGRRRRTPARAWEGPWHDLLPVWMRDGKDSSYGLPEVQAEYFIPLDRSTEALRAAYAVLKDWSVGERGPGGAQTGVFLGSELRCIAADPGLLSPNPVDVVTIHLSLNGHPDRVPDVMRALPELERALLPFGVRAHWGKLFTLGTLPPAKVYGDGLRRFRELAARHDPDGKFRNTWIRDALFTDLPPSV